MRSVDRAESVGGRGGTRHRVGRVLAVPRNPAGYACVTLWRDAKPRTRAVHRLVGVAFIPNPENFPNVLHGPNGQTDNSVANLYWGDQVQNMADRERDGTDLRGESAPRAKLTDDAVREIRALYAAGGWRQKDLAARFGIGQMTVSYIVRRVTWQHVI